MEKWIHEIDAGHAQGNHTSQQTSGGANHFVLKNWGEILPTSPQVFHLFAINQQYKTGRIGD